ncbi:MAG: PEP-CTERM sorting domain-containing protein [Acidobacteriaceae bacterium]|nr:PEP-CTERM sorting domain-containing protein [Acidobacteriaceae bacterium]MBV8569447.1 PEP-CTERM sorting domain-containing protein [Acidobacteriaceae bacterium]
MKLILIFLLAGILAPGVTSAAMKVAGAGADRGPRTNGPLMAGADPHVRDLVIRGADQSGTVEARRSISDALASHTEGKQRCEFVSATAPEPRSLALFGAGLLLITWILRRITRKNKA